MSVRAHAGLKATVEWNPSAPQFLLFLLKETPRWVKYKDDLYGPLGLILMNDVVRKPMFRIKSPANYIASPVFNHNATLVVKLPPFPQEKIADCEVFGNEWKERKFTRKELADAIEQILSEMA